MRSGKGRGGFGTALQQSAVPFFYSSAVPRPWKRREHPHRNAPAFMPFSQTGSPSGSRRASLLEDVSDADVAAPVFDHLARIDAFKLADGAQKADEICTAFKPRLDRESYVAFMDDIR